MVLCVCVCAHTPCMIRHTCGGPSARFIFLFFHHVGVSVGTEFRSGGTHLHQLSHLTVWFYNDDSR